MSKNETSLGKRMKKGFLWKLSEKLLLQGSQLVIQIVLARLLLPEDFGAVAILNVFIAISDVFILYSFTTALIQKKDADQLDFSSVFFFNLLFSIFLYLLLFVSAPFIANYYDMDSLTHLLRVLSLNIIIGAFSSVQNAIVSKNLNFKITFIKNLFVVIVYAVVSIALAVSGFGVWSLVLSKVASIFVGTVVLVLFVKWKPSLSISAVRMKHLFSFSSKVLGSNLLASLFQNISSLAIGKYYTKEDLGYYQKGQQFPQTAMSALDGSLSEVLYPSLSSIQDNLVLVKKTLSKSIRMSMYLVVPILIGGFVIARPLVLLLLGTKWEQCIPFFQLQCIVCLFWPLSARNHALNSLGKSNITLMTSFISNVISILFILIGARYNIYLVMIGVIVANFLTLFISSYFVNKYISYSIIDLVKDIAKPLLLAMFMGFCIGLVSYLHLDNVLTLFIQIVLGATIYIGVSYLLKFDTFFYLLNFLKNKINRKDNAA